MEKEMNTPTPHTEPQKDEFDAAVMAVFQRRHPFIYGLLWSLGAVGALCYRLWLDLTRRAK